MRTKLENVRLAVLVTDGVSPLPFHVLVRAVLDGGADMIQLREKNLSDSAFLERAKLCRQLARDALFIVNDRADIALLSQADGVHVGPADPAIANAREAVGPDGLVGASAYTIAQLTAAQDAGADYLGVGAVFATGTKAAPVGGLSLIRAAVRAARIPLLAIGGITIDNVASVIAAGAGAVAVSSAVIKSHDPAGATRKLKEGIAAAVRMNTDAT